MKDLLVTLLTMFFISIFVFILFAGIATPIMAILIEHGTSSFPQLVKGGTTWDNLYEMYKMLGMMCFMCSIIAGFGVWWDERKRK